ncbi:MAG: WbqC family protein [Calditrichaeota bacterium]|nr:WbqC family protein [Calditrichota bacterium]
MKRPLTTIFPEYFPSISTFRKLIRAGVVLVLDDRPIRSSGKINRMAIKTTDGKRYLTVPIFLPKGKSPAIRNLQIDPTRAWHKKHHKSLLVNYKNAPYFEHYWPVVEPLFGRDYSSYMELFHEVLSSLLSILKIAPKFVYSSHLRPNGSREEQILALLQQESCSGYLIEADSESYFDGSILTKNGYSCEKIPMEQSPYLQQFRNFEPNLSVFDLLMNVGPETKSFLLGT